MLSRLHTFALVGINGVPVVVEVDVSPGAIPKTVLVGLPELAVKESTHRVERALVNSGYQRPMDRVVINLAPAELRKDAGSFDLPIALGLLLASRQVQSDVLEQYGVVGELALDGSTRPVKGALSFAMAAHSKRLRGLLVPRDSAAQAAVVAGLEIIPVNSLVEAVGFLAGQLCIDPLRVDLEQIFRADAQHDLDYADVKGQEYAKRALTVAAAGGHNVLMIGPPGTGKTMLSRRLPTILPPLTPDESLETTQIYSALGRLKPDEPLLATRPFRDPHHTISDAGMVGGGRVPVPGEISLAHHGVLFLDELPEFNRRSLEVLRQPLESGEVTISRALSSTTFPSRFILIASMNPCPCGYLGDLRHRCKCSTPQIERYMGQVSGPLLDRIDLHIEVPTVPFQELARASNGTDSGTMREQVVRARAIQEDRFGTGDRLNAHMTGRQLRAVCALDADCERMLETGMEALGLSARAHDRILRMARTIADLEGEASITLPHLTEAINYRSLDRKLWDN